MTDNTVPTTTNTSTVPDAPTKAPDDTVDAQTYQQMLDILKDLTDHTHTFYDSYGTACQCNCACFAGDTLIHTREGVMTAFNLTGKTVEVYCIDDVWRSATWKSYGLQKLWSLTLNNGEVIRVTEDHRWPVIGKSEVVLTRDLMGEKLHCKFGDFREVEVVGVTDLGIYELVHCCEEPVTETFALASGIITKNCNCTCCTRGMVWGVA
jgi:hypothetical protein